jgi:peptide deformylase
MRILVHPDPALKQAACKVDPVSDADLPRLVAKMAEAMYEAPGVGLAAPQVGVCKRVIVLDIDDELLALCNPVVVESSDETEIVDEGCLSLPELSVPVERPSTVVCVALDLEGREVRIEAEELLARVLQHEIDHLDGILMIDRATPEERKAALQRYLQMPAAG